MAHTNPTLYNTEAPEVIMQDSDHITTSEELLQQIFNEQKEFRKEFKDFSKEFSERNANKEAGPARPQASGVKIGDENAQPKSNCASPPSPRQEPHPAPHPVPGYESSTPGRFPGNPSTMESASELHAHQHQKFLDAQREKLRSYEAEIKTLKESLETKTELWEGARKQNVDLTKQLSEQTIKVTNLQKMMTRAGRNGNVSTDSYISDQFLQVKNDILRMVRDHLSFSGKPYTGASLEVSELWVRAKVALALYVKFFSRDAKPFGYEDELLIKNPMRMFEEKLRKSRCDESVIKEWRVATVKACKLLEYDSSKYAQTVEHQIWKETLSSYCRHAKGTSERRRAHADLESLCKMAANLAILFRGSSIEYEWEQGLDVAPKDHEVIAVDGPGQNDEANYETLFIVFGGVVRGDKNTGLLEYGRTRLSNTQVVIRHRAPESLSHGIIR